MSDFKRPGSPIKRSPYRIRQFDGIGGPEVQVLRRFNRQGHNISSSVCNDIQDLLLNERGTMMLRDGSVKMQETGFSASVTGIFQVTIGGELQWGFLNDGKLTLIGIQEPVVPGYQPPDPFDLPDWDKPPDWPDWPWPEDPEDEEQPPDPSVPPGEQVCKEHVALAASPTSLTFQMSAGGPAPSNQTLYGQFLGWRKGYFRLTESSYWLDIVEVFSLKWILQVCHVQIVEKQIVVVSGKDANNAWLPSGTYKANIVLEAGAVLNVPVTLTVLAAEITLTGTLDFYFTFGETSSQAKELLVWNTGEVGSVLTWNRTLNLEFALSGPGQVTALPANGTVDEGNQEAVTVTVDPNAVAVGAYTDNNITISDNQGLSDAQDINVYIRALNKGDISATIVTPIGPGTTTAVCVHAGHPVQNQWVSGWVTDGTRTYIVVISWNPGAQGWEGRVEGAPGGNPMGSTESIDGVVLDGAGLLIGGTYTSLKLGNGLFPVSVTIIP